MVHYSTGIECWSQHSTANTYLNPANSTLPILSFFSCTTLFNGCIWTSEVFNDPLIFQLVIYSTQMRPPSPRSIALKYQTIEIRPGVLERADRATNSLSLNFLKDEAGRIMHKTAVNIFRIDQGKVNITFNLKHLSNVVPLGGFNQVISIDS